MALRLRFPFVFAAFAVALAAGCAPAVGDSCASAFDCSISGERTCDLARPNGACTVFGCEAESCPDDAVCVRWRPDPSRLSFTACMRRCPSEDGVGIDGACRFDEGYRCRSAGEIGTTEEGGDPIAEVVDLERPDAFFCIATEPTIAEE